MLIEIRNVMTNITNIFHEIQYLAAPREDDRPDVAAVEVLGAVEEHAGRLHGHGSHLRVGKVRG